MVVLSGVINAYFASLCECLSCICPIEEIESILQPHAENAIAHSYSINIRGEPMTYCNKRYREMFLEDDSELEAFNIKRLYAPLLWGKAMCPGDHATFFAAIMQASCTTGSQATDHTMVVQVGPSYLVIEMYRERRLLLVVFVIYV